ncbi:hypothetical protein ACWGAN_19950 [Streptomyces sp. NPDC054945]
MSCAETGTEGGKLRNGPSTSRTLPAPVPHPDLFRIRDWTTKGYAYRADLYAFAPDPIVSLRPVLDEDPGVVEEDGRRHPGGPRPVRAHAR